MSKICICICSGREAGEGGVLGGNKVVEGRGMSVIAVCLYVLRFRDMQKDN